MRAQPLTAVKTRQPRRPSILKSPRLWFLLPAVLWALTFTFYPIIYTAVLSFQQISTRRGASFVGVDNFLRAISDYQFLSALRFTVLFVVITVALQVLLGLALAIAVNREMRGKSFIRSLLLLPLFATPVGIGYLGIIMFAEGSGPVNSLLIQIQHALAGIGVQVDLNPFWRSDPFWAGVGIGILEVWQWTPFCFLILLAGLQSIPDELYEAMRLDSSRGWDAFRHITLPLLKPVMGITLLLKTVEAFKVIDIPFAFTKGGPGIATQTYTMYVWRTAFTAFDWGYAAALGLILLIMVIVTTNLIIWFGGLRKSFFGEA
ncbi:MAG: sugar ABC transporter permease [Deinococcota bacterium]|jgi:multiple sugar transport system permease protein|nr:sugar ABC transporter permease [Deinococcota bacterium]